jgi:hypothetical protein
VPRLDPGVIEGRLAEWRRLLRQSTTQARAVLQRMLRGRLVLTPAGIAVPEGLDERGRLTWLMENFAELEDASHRAAGYEFAGETRFDRLFAGLAAPAPAWTKPLEGDRSGMEHITDDDTLDGDYGKVLEQAHHALEIGDGQLLASPKVLTRAVGGRLSWTAPG